MNRKNRVILALLGLFLFGGVMVFAQKVNSSSPSGESYKLSLVKISPVFPGCKGTEFEKRKCLSESLAHFFESNVNSDVIKNIHAQENGFTVAVFFQINKEGSLSLMHVYPENETIIEEIHRVINLAPCIKPGIRKHENVNVAYSITLRMDDDKLIAKGTPTHY